MIPNKRLSSMKHYMEYISGPRKWYKMDTKIAQSMIEIDSVLETYGLFLLEKFGYVEGDCLFYVL